MIRVGAIPYLITQVSVKDWWRTKRAIITALKVIRGAEANGSDISSEVLTAIKPAT
jgi:hypothetical protein